VSGEDAQVGRTSWEGGKRKTGRLAKVIPSAPPLSRHTRHLVAQLNLSGGALGVNAVRRPEFRLPPSQLVQPTEASAAPASCAILSLLDRLNHLPAGSTNSQEITHSTVRRWFHRKLCGFGCRDDIENCSVDGRFTC